MNRRQLLSALAAAALPLSAKPRLRPALCAYSFRKELAAKTLTYSDLVHRCVDWNVDGLDLTVYWFPSTGPEFTLPLRRLAYRQGIEIYSISVRTELTRAEPQERAKEVAALENWIETANALGASHIRVFGGNVPKGASEDEAAAWVVECLQRAGERAARTGVILGLENHHGITTRAERILDIVRRVNSPWVQVNLDTGNFREDLYRQVEMLLPYAANVQVKVSMPDGTGKRVPQDWSRIIAMLAKAEYKGYLALEYEEAEPALEAVPRHLHRLRQLLAPYAG